MSRGALSRALARIVAALRPIWVRLLLVNVGVVLVPVFGLEFARTYERQLLFGLERDMNDLAALTAALLEDGLARGAPLDDEPHRAILASAARRTHTRLRVLEASGAVVIDALGDDALAASEAEPARAEAPSALSLEPAPGAPLARASSAPWLAVPERSEVKAALGGRHASYARIARRPHAVLLFTATPVLGPPAGAAREVAGAIYVTRSTAPVMVELHRIRAGLFKVLLVALCISVGTTLLLAFSISRPLALLSRAAQRIARGERNVPLPLRGSGEIRELSGSFKTMTEELDRRLVYISEFSADVAHEFKSPLTSMRGAAELLSEGAHADPTARARFLGNILLDTERLDRLVTRLLVLSRIEASAEEMTLFDLRSLLEKVIARARERSPVELRYASRRFWVCGREADLETALGNLVDNAQRYAPAGKPVLVDADDDGAGVRVSVRDEGPGVPEARRGRIFDRFYTTDADRGGTGLGLAIVDSVARGHGGRVALDADCAAGACFRLWLPAAHDVRGARGGGASGDRTRLDRLCRPSPSQMEDARRP